MAKLQSCSCALEDDFHSDQWCVSVLDFPLSTAHQFFPLCWQPVGGWELRLAPPPRASRPRYLYTQWPPVTQSVSPLNWFIFSYGVRYPPHERENTEMNLRQKKRSRIGCKGQIQIPSCCIFRGLISLTWRAPNRGPFQLWMFKCHNSILQRRREVCFWQAVKLIKVLKTSYHKVLWFKLWSLTSNYWFENNDNNFSLNLATGSN